MVFAAEIGSAFDVQIWCENGQKWFYFMGDNRIGEITFGGYYALFLFWLLGEKGRKQVLELCGEIGHKCVEINVPFQIYIG
jgi:hypothetical protein